MPRAGRQQRTRLDQLLVERGLAESRSKAQALIMAGAVLVKDRPAEKPGAQVRTDAPVRLREGAAPQKYVSRGGLKLEAALDRFGIMVSGRACADLGASTGGFTDCLLQRGAARVHAVDVGYGQLHPKLRADPRVAVHERVNARHIGADLLGGERVDLVTMDLSFISLRLVLPAAKALLKAGGEIVALVKPQFEVGKGEVGKGGVVRDPALRARAMREVAEAARALGLGVVGEMESPVLGPAGNVEFLLYLRATP
jgi:23S rRNA (cytidine1920-2'-O)/16S rRNA (cytidine1409-2'-O)-methyltransferase